MGVPTISTVSPADAETNVYLNEQITVLFSEALDTSTVNQNTFQLVHQTSQMREFCTVSLSANLLTVTIVPNHTLDSDETYILHVIGVSSGFSFYVKSSASADGLVTTGSYTFTTGNDIEAYTAEKTESQYALEGDLVLPADIQVVAARRLDISEVTPKNHSAEISVSTTQVTVRFSANIDDDVFTQDMAEFNVYPLMGMSDYLALDDGSGSNTVFSKDAPNDTGGVAVDFTLPTGTWAVEDDTIVWTMDTGETTLFPYNTEVEVILYDDIQDTYGNTLQEARKFVFTLEAYPIFSGVRQVERELATLPEVTHRDIIHAFIWRNSIRAWEEAGFSTAPDIAHGMLSRYAHITTCLDILDNAELPKTVLAGQRKSMGDFFVGWDANAVGRMGLKYQRLLDELKTLTKGLQRHIPRWVVKGGNVDRPNWRSRTWTSTRYLNTGPKPGAPVTESIPAANTRTSRASTLPGKFNSWD